MIVIHVVHGTFPHGYTRQLVSSFPRLVRRLLRLRLFRLFARPKSFADRRLRFRKRYWFHRGSEFEVAVKELLTAAGHENTQFVRFFWSGNNSFSARRAASSSLRDHLSHWRARFPDSCQVLVAHSHGGTIAAAAVDQNTLGSAAPINGLVTLASPFIRLRERLHVMKPNGLFDN